MLLSTTALCAGGRVARKWLLRVWGLSQRVVTAKHYVFMLALLQYLNVFLPSHAAEVTQIKSTLVIEGKIVAEDVARVEMLLAKNESAGTPIRNLELSSQGGDLNAAIAIGRLVRSRWMSTRARGFVFGQNHVFCGFAANEEITNLLCSCDSACFFIWAAGTYRSASGGVLGLHRPFFSSVSGQELAQRGVAESYLSVTEDVRDYFRSMQIPEKYFEVMMSKASNEVYRLNEDEVKLLMYTPLAEEVIIDACGEVADKDPLYEYLQSKKWGHVADPKTYPALSLVEISLLKKFDSLHMCGLRALNIAQDRALAR